MLSPGMPRILGSRRPRTWPCITRCDTLDIMGALNVRIDPQTAAFLERVSRERGLTSPKWCDRRSQLYARKMRDLHVQRLTNVWLT